MQPQNPQQPPNEQPNNPPRLGVQNLEPKSVAPIPPALTPNSEIQTTPPVGKPRRWKTFFIFLTVANIITIVFPLVVLLWAIQQANSGYSGTEYIGFALLPLLFAGIFVAAINVLTIGFYLYKHRPKRLLVWLGLIVCLLSLGYLVRFGLPIYRSYFELKSYRETGGHEATITRTEAISAINSCKLIELKKLEGTPPRLVLKADCKQPPLGDVEYASNNDWNALKAAVKSAPASCNYDELTVLEEGTVRPLVPITVEKATELINSCKSPGSYKGLDFYYHYTYVSESTLGIKIQKDMVENSSTGILLAFSTTNGGDAESIHVADRNVAQLLPVAREAQKACNYNFLIHYGDALHGNDKVEGEPTYMQNYNNKVTN